MFTIFTSAPSLKTELQLSISKPICATKSGGNERKIPFKPNKKAPYGSSRRSILKKSFTQEQVVFSSPLSSEPNVAIIGGGMSGLLCALSLENRGVRSTVFDTGIHGLGGRMATRIIDPQPLVFDHAAQFFTASDSQFADLVNDWRNAGLVKDWQGTIGKKEAGKEFVPFSSSSPRYVAVNGMRHLADSLLNNTSLITVTRPCWISALEPFNGMWHLSENGKSQGKFDIVVIAHNGKCANRLLSSSGLPQIAKQMKRLELSSIWALMAAFEKPLLDSSMFEGAFVEGDNCISWMGNNSSKLMTSKSPECWTFFSTSRYGKRNKVPQENIPKATAERIKEEMLEAVESVLGVSRGSIERPIYTRLQLWGAALPCNSPKIPFIFDGQGRAGICGDWLLGSNVECAALSGIALANHIADYLQSGAEDYSYGLHKEFETIDGHDIGQFSGF